MEPKPGLDTDPRVVGERVRVLRQAAGVSVAELARRAGLGEATLLGLETGTGTPTLEMLWAVTAQLGVSMGALLDAPPVHRTVGGTAVEAALLEKFEDDHVTYELYRLRVPPGLTQTSAPHQTGVSEHLTVFSGTLVAGPADAPLTAGPGHHISWLSDVRHGYRALGPDEVRASLLMRYPRP